MYLKVSSIQCDHDTNGKFHLDKAEGQILEPPIETKAFAFQRTLKIFEVWKEVQPPQPSYLYISNALFLRKTSIVRMYFRPGEEYSALPLTSVTGKQPEKFSSKFVPTFGNDPVGGGCVRGRCSKVQLEKPESQTSRLKFCFLQTKILLFKTDWHQLLKICIIEQRFLFE